MRKKENLQEPQSTTSRFSNKAVLIGAVGGLAAIALLSMARSQQNRTRRYADRGEERRNPMHFFLAGSYPRRRAIDRSGQRPLFERRQSVYDSY